MTAELVDTMARREDDGGRGYDDGAAAGASAVVGNGEGGRQGGMACPGPSMRDVEASRRPRRGRHAGDAVASSGAPASPPCLPGGEEANGLHGPAQRWAARWAGWWVAAR